MKDQTIMQPARIMVDLCSHIGARDQGLALQKRTKERKKLSLRPKIIPGKKEVKGKSEALHMEMEEREERGKKKN